MFTRGVWFRLPSRQALLVESTFLNRATLRLVEPIVLALDNKLCKYNNMQLTLILISTAHETTLIQFQQNNKETPVR